MNAPKHTQGPWSQFDDGGKSVHGYPYGHEYSDTVWGPKGPGFGLIADCSNNGQRATDESIANAKLIAAAPDLLDALKAILPFTREYDVFHNDDEDLRAAWDKVNAAFAKAEGRAES